MNTNSKGALLFVGGAALGALAVYALTRGDSSLKPLLADVMAGGLNLKDKILGVVDQAKENMEDLIAEAEQARKNRDTAAAQAAPAEETKQS
ncbi:MAG: hypothetical protein ACLGSA_15055 [Acidobacteriota bacterium]